MKKKVFFLVSMVISLIASANSGSKVLPSSWINNKIIQYYESDNVHQCKNNFYDNDEFVPLSLSFNNQNQVNIIFRYEQRILTYNIKSVEENTIIIFRGEKELILTNTDTVLKLEFNGNTIFFTKVSDYYSIDVFTEFIKSKIFNNYDNYLVTTFSGNKDHNIIKISRNSFESILKNIFKCKNANIVTLGLFEYKNLCLPEIALYYDEKSKQPSPKTFGIIKEEDHVKFIDASGVVILMLKGVKK